MPDRRRLRGRAQQRRGLIFLLFLLRFHECIQRSRARATRGRWRIEKHDRRRLRFRTCPLSHRRMMVTREKLFVLLVVDQQRISTHLMGQRHV